MAALVSAALGCGTCSPRDPAAPKPEPADVEILPLSMLCGGPCDDYAHARAKALEHTRRGVAADDPYRFAATDTCGSFERILSYESERGPVRQLFFSAGALVAAHERAKGASRWFGRRVQTTRPIEGDEGHERSSCTGSHSLRAEAAATLSHQRGVLVFRPGPAGWGRLDASLDGSRMAEGAGWLRSTRVRTLAADASGLLTVTLGVGSPEDLAVTFRYALAKKAEDGRLTLVETRPEGVGVELSGRPWPRGEERPLQALRFEDEGFPTSASMHRFESIRLTLEKKWASFDAAYHPILE